MLGVATETPGVSTKMAGVATEMAGVSTGNLYQFFNFFFILKYFIGMKGRKKKRSLLGDFLHSSGTQWYFS